MQAQFSLCVYKGGIKPHSIIHFRGGEHIYLKTYLHQAGIEPA